MFKERQIHTDVLIIGSGIAGLNFALGAKQWADVLIVTKKRIIESNTNYAQGGIAAVLGPTDSPKSHIDDTLRAGCGLSDPVAVKILVEEGPTTIDHLIQYGVGFDVYDDSLALALEGGHSYPRIVHAGDYTGSEIERKLVASAKHYNISVLEYCIAFELMLKNGECRGVRALDIRSKEIVSIASNVTVLATGGIGQIYEHTTNPTIATGDGVGIAARAGAQVMDMEFIQFHPTTLFVNKARNFLISEAVRGEGAILRDSDKNAFMQRYHEMKDLAPRDTVSRAVFEELKKGPVYLDITFTPEQKLRSRFPSIFKTCLKHGINISKEMIPVVPAAHYLCGGIKTDYNGETSIPRLFACGECACTGVHGANRLASNSLLESVVFSTRGVKRAKTYKPVEPWFSPFSPLPILGEWKQNRVVRKELQQLMWQNAGIVRREEKLVAALARINALRQVVGEKREKSISQQLIELDNMLLTASIVTQAALLRKESRGTHFNEDYPQRDDEHWLRHLVFKGEVVQNQ